MRCRFTNIPVWIVVRDLMLFVPLRTPTNQSNVKSVSVRTPAELYLSFLPPQKASRLLADPPPVAHLVVVDPVPAVAIEQWRQRSPIFIRIKRY